jgi:hypothetical protein
LEALFLQIRSLNHDMPKKDISGIGAINTSQCIRYLDRSKMDLEDTVRNVTAVDPMEVLILHRTKQRTATINQWRLTSPTIAQEEAGCFEGTYKIKNQVLDDFFSILKGDMIHIGFANLLTTSNNQFKEFTFASILSLTNSGTSVSWRWHPNTNRASTRTASRF